jgi:hypothetical protein
MKKSLADMLVDRTGLASSEVAKVLEELGPEELGQIHAGAPCVQTSTAGPARDLDSASVRALLCA